jgi:hypothetical protein
MALAHGVGVGRVDIAIGSPRQPCKGQGKRRTPVRWVADVMLDLAVR